MLVDATGARLVAERLLLYANSEEARREVERFARDRGWRSAVESNRFYRIVIGCPERCRTLSIGTNDDVVVVLVPLAARADRARAEAERAYAGLVANGLEGWDDLLEPVDLIIVVPVVCFFFLPFVARHFWVARRAQRTPYERSLRGLPSRVVDVSASAESARRQASMVHVGSVAIVSLTAVVAATVPFEAALAVSLLATPLCWLLKRRVYADRRQLPARPGPSALDRAGLFKSVRVRLEIVAAHFAALFMTTLSWVIGGLPILVAAGAARAIADGSGAARFAALAFVVVLVLVNIGPVFSRLARRFRVVAADREQEHRRRHPILYLRAFGDDHRLIAAGGPQTRAANEVLTFRARIPYEEVIARELNRFGAVAAVAEPGRPRLVPPLGAPRHRLSSRSWKAGVSAQMREAAVIAIAVGSSEGLVWELREATRAGHLDRVLLVVPPDEDEAIRTRWRASLRSIADSGGPFVFAPVDAAAVLVAELDDTGVRRAVVADRRDEHTYVAAIDRALADATDQLEHEPVHPVDELDALRLGTTVEAPLGSPREIGVAIVLFVLTLSLYAFYWVFKTHEELKAHTGRGLGGELGLVLWLCFLAGGLPLTAEIATMHEDAEEASPVTRWTGLWFFPGVFLVVPAIVGWVKVQRALNQYWTHRGAPWPARPPVHPALLRLADARMVRNRRWLDALLRRYRIGR
jgi:hypothetical protein